MRTHCREAKRNRKGSIIVVALLLVAVLAFTLLSMVQWGITMVSHFRYQSANEAAALAAASEVGRIVINDPHYGFIGLSDASPIGKATIAGDGEALPVTGINTIVATARLDYIIAMGTGSNDLIEEARLEAEEANRAALVLSNTVRAALQKNSKQKFFDMNGSEIHPYEKSIAVFKTNLANHSFLSDAKVKEFHLDLGGLKRGGYSNAPLPKPLNLAELPPEYVKRALNDSNSLSSSSYPSFVNLPVDGLDFYLIGLGEQVSLVSTDDYICMGNDKPASIVKLVTSIQTGLSPTMSIDKLTFRCSSCAMPNYARDTAPSAALMITFPDGLPVKLRSIQDLLTERCMDQKNVTPMLAANGDFPMDKTAILKPDPDRKLSSTRRQLCRGFLHWLRTAHTKPNIESVWNYVNSPLKSNQFIGSGRYKPVMAIVLNDGTIFSESLTDNPFSNQTVYDGQEYVLAFDSLIADSKTWTVTSRDLSAKLGTISGGKHGGQPMPPARSWSMIPEHTPLKQVIATYEYRRGIEGDIEKLRSAYVPGRLAFEFQIAAPKALN